MHTSVITGTKRNRFKDITFEPRVPFLLFSKLGESSKINGFIGSLMYTVKGMSHSSNVGLLQVEPKFITDAILIKLGYK